MFTSSNGSIFSVEYVIVGSLWQAVSWCSPCVVLMRTGALWVLVCRWHLTGSSSLIRRLSSSSVLPVLAHTSVIGRERSCDHLSLSHSDLVNISMSVLGIFSGILKPKVTKSFFAAIGRCYATRHCCRSAAEVRGSFCSIAGNRTSSAVMTSSLTTSSQWGRSGRGLSGHVTALNLSWTYVLELSTKHYL